jgi:hypothetical protein
MTETLAQQISRKLADKIVEENAALGEFSFRLGPAKLPGQDAHVIAQVAYMRTGNPLPHFSIVGRVYRTNDVVAVRGVLSSDASPIKVDGRTFWLSECGQCTEAIVAAFPVLAPFMQWHLCAADGPLHYVSNAVYWAQAIYGVSEYPQRGGSANANDCFNGTVVLGAATSKDHPDKMPHVGLDYLETDAGVQRAHIRRHITAWCEERRGRLLFAFQRAMAAVMELDPNREGLPGDLDSNPHDVADAATRRAMRLERKS